ncbi:MAG: BRO family protein [Clostridium sp.]|uniref:BRO family protein n=1 Tax=Clostridium sp. TaxID=1506 RepID=UPI003EE5A096
MKDLQVFNNEVFGEIRVLEKDGQPWFVGKDLTEKLGYQNGRDALSKHVDAEDKVVAKCDTLGGKQSLTIINESGMYSLVISSKLPSAKEFKRWVTNEVLPSIRKHGAYMTDNVVDMIYNDPQAMIDLLTKLKEEKEARVEAEKKNTILMHVNKTYTATEIAKELGFKSAIALNKYLVDKGIQYKVNKSYVLYSDYADLGYTSLKQQILDNGKVIYNRHFTQMGRDFIINLHKDESKNNTRID